MLAQTRSVTTTAPATEAPIILPRFWLLSGEALAPMLPPRVRSVLLADSEGKNVIVPETVGRDFCEGRPPEGGDLSVVILYMVGTSHVVVGASVEGDAADYDNYYAAITCRS
jgi:hypothetical protein